MGRVLRLAPQVPVSAIEEEFLYDPLVVVEGVRILAYSHDSDVKRRLA